MNEQGFINNDDFILASYPRSGNTWLRFILANLMSRNEVEINFHNYHQYIPDIHVIKKFSEWHSYPPFPRIIKSHLLPQPEYKNVIYIVRDPRAAIISHWHYKGQPGDLEKFIFSDDIWPAVWSEHVEKWVEYSRSNNILIIKYENLLSNVEEQLQKILGHIGVTSIDRNDILKAIDRSSFDQMSKIEKEKGFWRSLDGDKFVRSGKQDSWEEEIPQSINEKIIKYNNKMMEYFNYI